MPATSLLRATFLGSSSSGPTGPAGRVEVNYIREDLATTCDSSFSNNFVEVQCLVVPSIDLALITIYRPPRCPTLKFKEAISWTRAWLGDLEQGSRPLPAILLSGDLNFGFLKDWSSSATSSRVTWVGAKVRGVPWPAGM